jgi:IS30 family transposase
LPKGCDLSIDSQDEFDKIADSLNNRPRATRDSNAPPTVFAQMLAMAQLPSTSIQKNGALGT